MDGKENDTYLLHGVPIDANVHGYFARKAAERASGSLRGATPAIS
jgi:hypothetical protein